MATLATYGYDASGRRRSVVWSGDLAHGVVEGPAEDPVEKVDGGVGEVALGPAPVGVFDNQTRISGQKKIAAGLGEELDGGAGPVRRIQSAMSVTTVSAT